MVLTLAVGYFYCDGCEDDFSSDLVEGVTWDGPCFYDHDDVDMPEGWVRDGEEHYCPVCRKEVGL